MKRHLFDLRPTQFAVGMFEVERKIKKLRGISEKEVKDYLDAHPIPIVLCRNDEAHLIDHHHLARALLEVGIEKVPTEITADLSHLDDADFWKQMEKRGWTHLFDQFGAGPHAPRLLPFNIRGLADDSYRSLAWAIREEGGYEKSTEPFCEFRWADFLRKKVTIDRSEDGFKKAVAQALKLARTEEASHLPGYQPGKN